MPRPNRQRTIASEANLARRIAFEREQRSLSYEALAKLMTEAGCSMQGSAIFRIEKGEPPRRVTVDELVAFGGIFGLTLDALLEPIELVEQREAKELIVELDAAGDAFADTIARMMRLLVAFDKLADSNPELSEYVDRHWQASQGDLPDLAARIAADVEPNETLRTPLRDGINRLIDTLQLLAGVRVWPELDRYDLRLDKRKRVVRDPRAKRERP